MLRKGDRETVRPPAVAGSFYPRAAGELAETVTGLLANAQAAQDGRVRAIIAPHAGYVYSGAVAAEAFSALTAQADPVERFVIIGPAHYVPFRGIALSSADAFRTPLGDVPLDAQAIGDIANLPQIVTHDDAHAPEHALEVELPFLQTVAGDVPVVPLVVGSARAEEVAEVVERLWDETTVIVVSTDLSHYHDYDTARRLDVATALAIEACEEQDIGRDDACGSLALRGMLIVAKRRDFTVARLDLRNSGDTAGDRRRVVGYGAWAVLEA